jgi:taurine dioxygenase
MSLTIRPLSFALGAEISRVDLRSVDQPTFKQIHEAFLKYQVLLFRGQKLTRDQHIAFSSNFGELDKNADSNKTLRVPECPEVLLVTHRPRPGGGAPVSFYQGNGWHSDRSFALVPAMASILRSIRIPEVGGDTMFANMYLAYETLSDGMKKTIAGLDGVHFGGKARDSKRAPPVAQPLVRVHPETGRKSLFIGNKVKQIVGMAMNESESLLDFLCNHAERPQFCYRHVWRVDDVVIWDNRCTNHLAVNDFDLATQERHLERMTVNGTPSGYVYDGPIEYSGPRL